MKFRNAQQVAEWRLCVGCGACYFACPENKITLINQVDLGIRPILTSGECGACDRCVAICPGYMISQPAKNNDSRITEKLRYAWGPILEIWEGYSVDKQIRYNGSSGGLTSAISLYCLEMEGIKGVLHVAGNPKAPTENEPVISRSRSDMLLRGGSRYSPASPCSALAEIIKSDRPFIFIGKPCDVHGMKKAQAIDPTLNEKVYLNIGIFCAGTPSSQGTFDLLKSTQENIDEIEEVRYRGTGWPGMFSVRRKGNKSFTPKMSYREAWNFLENYRPYRCYLCPDITSELADISCGDAWHREIKKNDSGYSIVLVRTERGKQVIERAMKAGYIHLRRINVEALEKSQKNLLLKKGMIWGRLITMKMLGIPTPRYEGFYLFKNWCRLPVNEKAKSILGTARRVIQRNYYKPMVFK